MACATLKRPLDFDPLLHDHHKSPQKRQRCAPMAVSPTPPTSSSASSSSSSSSSASATSKSANPNSPFGEVKPPMTNVVIAAKLQAELRRMQRRRQIKAHHRSRGEGASQDSGSGSDSDEPEMMAASSPTSAPSSAPPAASFAGDRISAVAAAGSSGKLAAAADVDLMPSSPGIARGRDQDEKPLFNFKQVSLICERLVREREEALREEYDKTLTSKLAEQYDAFVKFTYDQIQRRLNDRPMSYVS